MSVYLAAANSGVAVPAFKERDAAGLMPGEMDEVPIIVIEKNKMSPFLGMLLSNIPTLARCQAENVYVNFSTEYFNAFKSVTEITNSIHVPQATFHFENLSEAQIIEVQSAGLNQVVGNTGAYSGSPNFRSLPALFRLGPVFKRVPPGSVSAQGYLAYSYAMKGYQLFSTLWNHMLLTQKIQLGFSSANVQTRENAEVPRLGYPGKMQKNNGGLIGTIDSAIQEIESMVLAPVDSTKKFPGLWISLSNLEASTPLGGIFFPYFEGMVTMDKTTVRHFFSTHFLQMLGADSTIATSVWDQIRPGFRTFAFSRSGLFMSHLYTGMRLAIETQSMIALVHEGAVYHGFALLGSRQKVRLYGKVYSAVSREELIKEIGTLNKQDRVLGELLAVLNAPVDDDGNPLNRITKADISMSRGLVRAIISAHGIGTDDVQKMIREIVDQLVYGDKYPVITHATLLDFLSYVETGDMTIIDKYPAMVSSGWILRTDRVSVGLGIFGPRAPVVSYGGGRGQTFTLPRNDGAEDPNLVVVDNVRRLRYLPFSTEPINIAASRWDGVFKDGKFTFPHGRRGKNEFTNGQFMSFKVASDPSFSQMYAKMKVISRRVRDGLRTGKRARADDDGESGPSGASKRQRKEAQSAADAF